MPAAVILFCTPIIPNFVKVALKKRHSCGAVFFTSILVINDIYAAVRHIGNDGQVSELIRFGWVWY